MIKQYAIANIDGRVFRIVTCGEEEIDAQLDAGDAAHEAPDGVSDLTYYVTGGQLTEKQPFSLQMTNPQITADGIDECVIGNIPASTTVEWPDGQADEVTDGEVRFSVDLAGTYTLKFSAIPYLDQEVTIEAVAAT